MKVWQSVLAAVVVLGGAVGVWAENFEVDPVHSSAVFRIKHQGTSFLYGRINGVEGKVAYDAAKPEASNFEVTLEAKNIDTNNKMRDDDLRSSKFFNAKEFPKLTFKSTSVKKGEGNNLEVTGDLTIHGVTKSVTVTLEHTGDGKNMKGTSIIGFETTFTIKRSDYGMTEMMGGVGDDVKIMLALEADKK